MSWGATVYKWISKYEGMYVSAVKRLRSFEDENQRLKHLVANLTLDNQALNYDYLLDNYDEVTKDALLNPPPGYRCMPRDYHDAVCFVGINNEITHKWQKGAIPPSL